MKESVVIKTRDQAFRLSDKRFPKAFVYGLEEDSKQDVPPFVVYVDGFKAYVLGDGRIIGPSLFGRLVVGLGPVGTVIRYFCGLT
jgi:hypothetical protein